MGKDFEVKWGEGVLIYTADGSSVVCPTCTKPIKLTPEQFSGNAAMACVCGFEATIDAASAVASTKRKGLGDVEA